MIFKQVTSKLFGKSSGKSPGLWLGAFGKHPGWNDHMDDQGLETERLIAAKRVIYMEGVAAAIDSGAWDKLDPAQRLDEFGHEFIWRSGGEMVLGRLWSSRDGKGRSKYPLVLCAQYRDLPAAWALDTFMPRLASLEDQIKRASTADMVIASLDAARAALRELAANRPTDPGTHDSAFPADRPEFGADQAGLMRILYQAEREWGPYLAGSHETSRARLDAPERSHHIRVPGCAASATGRLKVWHQFATRLTASWVSCLIVTPRDNTWADVIVGEPIGPQLFCLKAGESRIPLSSDIPYNIDAQTVVVMRQRIASLNTTGNK